MSFTVGVIAQTGVTFGEQQMALFDLSLNQNSWSSPWSEPNANRAG